MPLGNARVGSHELGKVSILALQALHSRRIFLDSSTNPLKVLAGELKISSRGLGSQ